MIYQTARVAIGAQHAPLVNGRKAVRGPSAVGQFIENSARCSSIVFLLRRSHEGFVTHWAMPLSRTVLFTPIGIMAVTVERSESAALSSVTLARLKHNSASSSLKVI